MTRAELTDICLNRFEKDFARTHTPALLQSNGEALLLDLLEEAHTLKIPAVKREQLIFRAAYLFESVCLADPSRFEKVSGRFLAFFLKTDNTGAKRSFGKMAATLLPHPLLIDHAEELATRCCERIIEPNAKPAAQIWAMEILFKLTPYVEWLPETLDHLIETLRLSDLPSLRTRIKRWNSR